MVDPRYDELILGECEMWWLCVVMKCIVHGLQGICWQLFARVQYKQIKSVIFMALLAAFSILCRLGSMSKVAKSFICRGCLKPVTSAVCTSVDIGASAKLELVDKFCYLGDMLSVDGDADAAVEARIGWNKFRQLVRLLRPTNKEGGRPYNWLW